MTINNEEEMSELENPIEDEITFEEPTITGKYNWISAIILSILLVFMVAVAHGNIFQTGKLATGYKLVPYLDGQKLTYQKISGTYTVFHPTLNPEPLPVQINAGDCTIDAVGIVYILDDFTFDNLTITCSSWKDGSLNLIEFGVPVDVWGNVTLNSDVNYQPLGGEELK